MLSSSKSLTSTDNVSNKKKRKVLSPLSGPKSSKVVKLAVKEDLVGNIHEKEGENADEKKLNSSNDSIEIITDDDKKDLEQSDQQNIKKGDNTPKRRNLEKNKKLDRSQQKPGALTKFLKRADKEVEEVDSHDNNLSELKDKKDCQNTSVHKENDEICLNEGSGAPLNRSELQDTQLSETSEHLASKCADLSLQETDCDITTLSSDNEASSELDQSISNRSKEMTDKPATPVTPKSDKDTKNKIKKLTPKQLEKKQEIARRKEEKRRLKMVCICYMYI